MITRNIQADDLPQFLDLLTHLHNTDAPAIDEQIQNIWHAILEDPNHHILVGVEDGILVTTCALIIVPNLTRDQRPYALIENVVTLPQYRGRGHASKILNDAKDVAARHMCYKIMLMTGSKRESTLNLYRRAGFNSDEKTAFIHRFD